MALDGVRTSNPFSSRYAAGASADLVLATTREYWFAS